MLSPPPAESNDRVIRPAPTAAGRRRPIWLLLVGAALGLALAAFGLLDAPGPKASLPSEAAARVGERVIRRVDYERVLAGVESDLRSPVDEALRRRVLDRMVDEELLVQRALDLGLAVIDRRIRGELTSALIDSIVAGAEAEEPSKREVQAHFEANRDFFTRPGRLHARTLFFSSHPRRESRREELRQDSHRADREDASAAEPRASAIERARRAASRIAAGESIEAVRSALADPQVSPLPGVLLPASKIRDYLGPTLLETIERLEVGEWSRPVESPAGVHLAQLVDREAEIVPHFDDVEALVRQDLERRRGDDALRRYLDMLRTEIPVTLDESLFVGASR